MKHHRTDEELWAEFVTRIERGVESRFDEDPRAIISVEQRRRLIRGLVRTEGSEIVWWPFEVATTALRNFGVDVQAERFLTGLQIARETWAWLPTPGAIQEIRPDLQRQLALRWVARLLGAISNDDGGATLRKSVRKVLEVLDDAYSQKASSLVDTAELFAAYDIPFFGTTALNLANIVEVVTRYPHGAFPRELLATIGRAFPNFSKETRVRLRLEMDSDLVEASTYTIERLKDLNGPPSAYVSASDLDAVALTLRFDAETDPERAAVALREFISALNRLHILEGGEGLRVEDWLIHEREQDFAGAGGWR